MWADTSSFFCFLRSEKDQLNIEFIEDLSRYSVFLGVGKPYHYPPPPIRPQLAEYSYLNIQGAVQLIDWQLQLILK